MLFNSIEFAVFLPLCFAIYWLIGSENLKKQNFFLLLTSYFFYAWWDWRFLGLMILSTLVDFFVGRAISQSRVRSRQKGLVLVSILTNLSILMTFKYCDFFIENLNHAFTLFGSELSISSLKIILPLGISFYTFQSMSYSIDIYRKKLSACTDYIQFAAFVSFFPQLVAGPIERARTFLPQFQKKRSFDKIAAVDGLRQILWGLFKKMCIADNASVFVDQIFANSSDLNAITLVLGAFFFSIQIYCDFSGYSDMALGIARLFGFRLRQNFNYPYFSRDPAEFWRRWHISLSQWFRDYLYIPLGGSRASKLKVFRNVFIVFAISGFWHGANWTFIVWGVVHALLFLPFILLSINRKHLNTVAEGRILPSITEALSILLTFTLVSIAWVFFRAENLSHALDYLSGILNGGFFERPMIEEFRKAIILLFLVFTMFIFEWSSRNKQHALEYLEKLMSRPLRYMLYYFILVLIYRMSIPDQQFIYFQF